MMQVEVKSIISARDFGTIFSARLSDEPARVVRIRTNSETTPITPVVGEIWNIEGEIRDTAYGPQIEAQLAVRVRPTGTGVKNFLAQHAPGIGPERAERLWSHYGLRLAEVLSDSANIEEIAAVIAPDHPNLGPRLAAACISAWGEAEDEAKVVLWLAERAVDDVRIARRAARILQDRAVERLAENPYILVPLLPWKLVDELGLKLLADRADPRRLVGAVDAAVKAQLTDGHTAGTLDDLKRNTAMMLGSNNLVTAAMAAGEAATAFIDGSLGWRAPGASALEDQLVETLKSVMNCTAGIRVPSNTSLERWLDKYANYRHVLHPEQRKAVLAILQNPLSCLSGGAGVGKTTTTRAVCDLWESLGGKLLLCAVAGKAALRLSRATGRLAQTVFRLLRSCEAPENGPIEKTRIDGSTLVIVDEASMLDLASASALLRHFEPGARLLLVGDDAQLPPIGFGLVYHKLVADSLITSRLLTVHRQNEASGIPKVSSDIRNARFPATPAFQGIEDGVRHLECDPSEIGDRIVEIYPTLVNDGIMILTPLNDGPSGVRTVIRRGKRTPLWG